MSFTVQEISNSGGINQKGQREHTRIYLVNSTILGADNMAVEAALPVHYGDAYPGDANSFLLNIGTVRSEGDKNWWTVTARYTNAESNESRGGGAGNSNHSPLGNRSSIKPPTSMGSGNTHTAPTSPNTNTATTSPTSRPWVIKWGSRDRQKLCQDDIHGDAIVNKAGQPFDPPITASRPTVTLSLTAYVASFNQAQIPAFIGHTNDATFLTNWPEDTVMCTGYSATTINEHGAWFWQLDITLEMNDAGWNPVKVLNAGTMYKESNIKPLQSIKDRSGSPITHPVPLSADGTRPLRANETPNYCEFDIYYQADYTHLLA